MRARAWLLTISLAWTGAAVADGPAFRVADLDAGNRPAIGVHPSSLTVFDDRLYFAGHTATAGRELWRSDGTAAGTEVVADLCTGRCWSQGVYPEIFLPHDGHLYFSACDAATCGLWRTDGGALERIATGLPAGLLPWQGALYYSTFEGDLYRTDGTGPGTRLLWLEHLTPWTLIPSDDEIFVFALDPAYSLAPKPSQLWRTDGTPEGTWRLLEDPLLVVAPFAFDGQALYRTDDALHLADGAGTRPLLPDPPFTSPTPRHVVDGELVVLAGAELWRTDGTAAGTERIAAGAADDWVPHTAVFEDEVYFVLGRSPGTLRRTVDLSGSEIVRRFEGRVNQLHVLEDALYVGTAPGETFTSRSLWRMADAASAPEPLFTLGEGHFEQLAVFRGEPHFRWSLAGSGELARGDAGGEVERLTRLADDDSSSPRHLTPHRGRIVFETEDFRKWVSDGTARGTFELEGLADPFQLSSRAILAVDEEAVFQGLRDFLVVDEGSDVVQLFDPLPGNERTVPGAIFVLDGETFFLSTEPSRDVDLWRGDRATGEIEAVVEDLPGNGYPVPAVELEAYGDGVAMALGGALFRTDGTADGTRRILDDRETSGRLTNLVAAGGRLFFISRPSTQADVQACRLWTSDGTTAGTAVLRAFEPAGEGVVFLRDLVAVGERVFFVVEDTRAGDALWTSDGTTAGTAPVRGGLAPRELTAFAGRLVFTADDGVHGREPWTSDGTAAGTALFLDLHPGPRASSPRHLTVIDRHLVFSADDGVHGAEPWLSDGTPEGTRLLQDLFPGPSPSDPEAFTAAGDLVYFNAGDEEAGFELWATARAALAGELTAFFLPAPRRALQGKPVVFTDRSGGAPQSWCWRFGDEPAVEPAAAAPACAAATPEARHVYSEPGVYTVTLRVERTGPGGVVESSTAQAEVEIVALCKPCLL